MMFMKKIWFVFFLGFVALFIYVSPAIAIPPPDNSSSDRISVNDRISANMSNVDDLGLVIVWNGNGAETVLNCQWTSGGNHGSASGDISKSLTKGDNYIVFVLYNRVYQGGLFVGGKWSYNFSLEKNGETVWRGSNHVRENDAAIKYWKVFKATVNSSGNVSLSESIESNILQQLRSAMGELESKLDRSAGVATPF